jgi:hypothetical protein
MPTFTATKHQAKFCRVTKRRPCLICQKPDWCVYEASGAFSVCMRVHTGAVKINQQGGGIFLHEPADKLPGVPAISLDVPTHRLAPIAVRDFAYRWLNAHSPALRHYRTLLTAPHGLLARGFQETQLAHYGALPRSVRERDQLARQLLRAVRQQFSDYASLVGVPGLWKDEHGAVHLWQPHHDSAVRLLIPVRDEIGRIQACQLRNGRSRGARYCWLSSAKWPNGTGSGSPLHFNFSLNALSQSEPIWIVEGFLKADAFAALRPNTPIIATGGVAVNHAEIIRHTAGRPVVIGYDQDYHVNETVCLQLARLIAERIASEGTADTTRIATWQAKAKGIDDAALMGSPIAKVSCADWLHCLPFAFQLQVISFWRSQRIPLPDI